MRRERIDILKLIGALFIVLLLGHNTYAQQAALQFVKGGGGGGFIGSNSTFPDPDEIFTSAIDKDDNLIVGGATTFDPYFDSIRFSYMVGSQYNGDNGFVAKYNSCGEIQWVSVIWGNQNEIVTGLDVDTNGNIYVMALVVVDASLIDSAVIVTPYGNTVFRNCDMILAKYNPDGHLLYLKTYIGNHDPNNYEAYYPQKGHFKRLKNNTFITVVETSGFGNVVDIEGYTVPVRADVFVLLDSIGDVINVGVIDTLIGNRISNFVLDDKENIYISEFNYEPTQLLLLDTFLNEVLPYTAYLVKTDTSFKMKGYTYAYYNGAFTQLAASGNDLYAFDRQLGTATFQTDTAFFSEDFGKYIIYKIDTGLNLVWASRPDFQSLDATFTRLNAAATKDNVYVGFQTRGTVVWDSFSVNTPVNTYDMAMLRLRATDGVCVEGKLLQGNITARDKFDIIKPEPQGGAYFMGTYAGSIGIAGYDTIYSYGNIASPDYFIVKWGLPCSDTLSTLDAPAVPINLVATATGINSIGINWNDVAQGETGFNLYRSPDGVSNWSMVATTAANTPLYSNTGLQPNTTYWYKATSFNQSSESAYSNIDSATTWPATCATTTGYTNTDSLYTFTTTNTGTAPFTYSWSINGNNSIQASLTAILDTAGTYYICATVTDSYNCTATACDTISILAPVCSANIGTTQTGTYAYSFNALSTGPGPYTYIWSVDGNTQGTTANPFTRTFVNTANSYNVCVTVSDANGCTATACDTVTIIPATCATSLNYSNAGNTYTFSTVNTGTVPYTYTWTNGSNPINGTDSAHVTLTPGTYNVCVTVTDANNCTAAGCQSVTIQPDTCSASMTYSSTGNSYTFTASSTGTAPYTYAWSNSDNTTQSITQQLQTGIHNVCVTVTDANGCTATACQVITIQPDTCSASLTYTNTGNSYTFTAGGTGTTPHSYAWSNNANILPDTTQAATLQLQAGASNVCVTVTDDNGCTATACQQIIISGIDEDVQAAITIYPNPVTDVVNVAVQAEQNTSIQITITDLQGRIINNEMRLVVQGSNLLAYSTERWLAGIYQLRAQYGSNRYTAKVVKIE